MAEKKENKLERFISKSILSTRNEDIWQAVLGEVDGERAVLLMNKLPFNGAKIMGDTTVIHSNDVYENGTICTTEKVKYSLIHPASDTHIMKYTGGEFYMVEESYAHYIRKTLPTAMEKSPKCTWIDNIFKDSCGRVSPYVTPGNEEVLYIDEEFVICPDLKWDRSSSESMYLLVIFRDSSLYTIRELNEGHLAVLLRAKMAVREVLSGYGCNINEFKLYFHYYPTFYRLHFHVSSIRTAWIGAGIGSSILLHDVIENITRCSTYYQECTLQVVISDRLYLYETYTT
ncbi:m7GpppX diphosphatase [Nematocida sp. LUAm3]|nr:m7GpppX diphosphatase [Nematocida sp. LUAm3]KAI5174068.1 m7GpppX diphosphatase [Nematocida sp. LUAm2]KAI5177189.1 m7GpppX diphosphatase [Nematocida sp. LUAm1]